MTAKRAKKTVRSAPTRAKSAHKRPQKSGAKPGVKQKAKSKSKSSVNKRKPVANRSTAGKSVAKPVSKPAAKRALPVAADSPLLKVVQSALDDMKAVNVKILDVRGMTDFADTLVIASGNSDRHVKSIADRVVEFSKKAGFRPMGVEGERDGEWVLVDLQDVIVHVMLPRVREFYRLENLWDIAAASREMAEQ